MLPDTGADAAADLPRRPRPGPAGGDEGLTDDLRLDATTRRAVLPDGGEVTLTPLQFAILAYLVARAGQPCSREAIMCEALGYAQPIGSRTVDMHIASLRSKLGRAIPIRAVRGVGYLVPRPDAPAASGGSDAAL